MYHKTCVTEHQPDFIGFEGFLYADFFDFRNREQVGICFVYLHTSYKQVYYQARSRNKAFENSIVKVESPYLDMANTIFGLESAGLINSP